MYSKSVIKSVSNYYKLKYIIKQRIYPGTFRIHPKYSTLSGKTRIINPPCKISSIFLDIILPSPVGVL